MKCVDETEDVSILDDPKEPLGQGDLTSEVRPSE